MLACLAAVAGMLTAGPAQAVIPPKDCGTIRSKGKRYNVKGDRVSCSRARSWSARHLSSGWKPRGWRCRDYNPRETRIRFRCLNGVRAFYAIRR